MSMGIEKLYEELGKVAHERFKLGTKSALLAQHASEKTEQAQRHTSEIDKWEEINGRLTAKEKDLSNALTLTLDETQTIDPLAAVIMTSGQSRQER